MEKQKIYDIEKKELTALITEMTLENLCITLDNIQIHIDLLRCLDRAEYKASGRKCEIGSESPPNEKSPEDMQETKEAAPSFQEGWSEDGKYYIGTFFKHLRGGAIGTEKSIYVPESVVRNLGLEYLDWVKAAVIYVGHGHGKDRYEYTLLEKHKDYDAKSIAEMDNRKIIEYGIVRYEEGIKTYYISGKTENSDILHKITLSDSDVIKFKIEKGDVIEYAYWSDDIQHGRIVWKHQQETGESLEKAIHKAENANHTSKKTKPPNTVKRAIKPTFQGYTICMVGGGNRNLHRGIKEEVERRNGHFIFCSGDEPKNTLESKLKKADCIVVFTESISHDSMHFTKAVCKKHHIAVSYTKNLGNVQFVTRINLLIKKMKKDADISEKQPGISGNQASPYPVPLWK